MDLEYTVSQDVRFILQVHINTETECGLDLQIETVPSTSLCQQDIVQLVAKLKNIS